MDDARRTVANPVTGETITFLTTSEQTAGQEAVMSITLAPAGVITPHSHRMVERFECLDGTFMAYRHGRYVPLKVGQVMLADAHALHGLRNDTDEPATVRVTVTPSGELDTILRALAGLARDGRLVPGKAPKDQLAMAALAHRVRFYQPPLPRWLYWPLMDGMAVFGRRAGDRLLARYDLGPVDRG
jgi:quercetin dioxygenase-like cupin family protein